jgi:hypothetical protein
MIAELRKSDVRSPKDLALALSEFPRGRDEVFQYLKRSINEDYGWPDQKQFLKNMAGTFLAIAQDEKRSGVDRAIALKGIDAAHDEKVLTSEQEKTRTEFTSTLFDKDNPLEVRLSVLTDSEVDFYDLAKVEGSTSNLRWLLRRGLDECELTFLRRACLQKILWRWRKEDESELKIGADKLVEIALTPVDSLCKEAMIFVKNIPNLAKGLVPGLVRNFEKYDDSEQEYAIEAMGIIAAHPELALPVIQKRFESGQNQPKCAVAMAQIIGANGLDAKPAINALVELLSNDNWEPYTSIGDFCKALGPKAAPAAPALISYLEKQKDPDNYLVTRISGGLALMGPDARESALAVTEYLKFAYEHYVGQVLLDLARAGLGKDIVPFALKHIDEDKNRDEIMQALALVGPAADKCVPKLIELLNDDEAQHQAADTLAYMGKRGREAGDKLRALARRDNENAGFALLCLFPDDEPTVRLGLKAVGPIWPQHGEKLEAILGPDVVKLKKIISATLDGNSRNGLLTQAERTANAKATTVVKPTVKILKATYGNTKKKTDVTKIVQRLFDSDAAAIRPNAKGLGIDNPAPKGKGKKLSIKYSVNGKDFNRVYSNAKREIRLSKVLLVGPDGKSLLKVSPSAKPSETTEPVFFSPAIHGDASVRKINDTTFRLEPFGVIGVPAPGFVWKLKSTEPPVFECRKAAGDTWMTIGVQPPLIDFEYARSKSLEDRAEVVIKELTTRDATINPNGVGSYGDGRFPGARGTFFGYSINDVAYQYVGIKLFRRDSSFLIEVSAPDDSLTHGAMMGTAGFFQLDADVGAEKRSLIPADVKEAVSKEIAKLLPILNMKTVADVEKMIEYTMSKPQLDRLKASGQLAKTAVFCIKDTRPRFLLSLQSIDWQRAELRESGRRVFFPVPPGGLTFFKVNDKWRISLR